MTDECVCRRMPDIDSLMQEWPGELEELFKEINLPTAALELELSDFVDIICGECWVSSPNTEYRPALRMLEALTGCQSLSWDAEGLQ